MTYNCLRSWSKPRLIWVCRIFSCLKQWLYTQGWPGRGDICTLVTGHKKPNKSDQTRSSIRPGYQLSLSAQKASEQGFIVTLWHFKAKLSLLLSFHRWQKVIDSNLNALHDRKTSETHLPEIWESVSTIHMKKSYIKFWNVWHTLYFVPNRQ